MSMCIVFLVRDIWRIEYMEVIFYTYYGKKSKVKRMFRVSRRVNFGLSVVGNFCCYKIVDEY